MVAAARKYRIEVVVDAAKARASTAGLGSSFNAAAAAAERAARMAEKAHERAADSAKKFADATALAAIRAADRAAKSNQRAADLAIAARLKQEGVDKKTAAAKELIAAKEEAAAKARARRIADAEAALAADSAQSKAKAEERKARAAEAAIDKMLRGIKRHDAQWRKSLSDEDIARRVHNQKIANLNEKRIESAMRAAGVEYRGFKNGWEGADKMKAAVGNLVGAFAGLVTGQAVLGAIVAEFDASNKSAIEATKFNREYRESLLELAALKGRLGGSGEESAESLTFRSETLQTREEAIAFQSKALGVGQSNIDEVDPNTGKVIRKGNMGEGDFKEFMRRAGAFQAAEHGDADTHGALAGMIPGLMKRRITADEGMAKVNQLYSIFQPGGASYSNLVAGFMKNAPLADAGIISPERLAAVESAFSVGNIEGHAAQTQAFVRATAGGIGRMKGVQMEGDTEKIGEYYKGLGATAKMDPVDIGNLVAADLKANGGKGEDNQLTYLARHGFGNQEDRLSLISYAAKKNSGGWDTFDQRARGIGVDNLARQKIDAWRDLAPEAHARMADVAQQGSQLVEGDKKGSFLALMTSSYAKMRAEGETGLFGRALPGKFEDVANASSFNVLATGVQNRTYRRSIKDLQAQAAKAGTRFDVSNEQWKAQSTEGQADVINRGMRAVGMANGDMMGGSKEGIALMARQLETANAMLAELRKAREEKQRKPAQPMPAPQRPAARRN